MSLFDYPRINFAGTLQLSPGTANNDDYAASFVLPKSAPSEREDLIAFLKTL